MKNLTFSIVLVLTLITLLVTSCSNREAFGEKFTVTSQSQILKVKDVMMGDQYINQTVFLEGKIAVECGSGCWFNLDDGTGTIYVDLLATNFAIPQMTNKMVTVKGKVVKDEGEIKMVGLGVRPK